MRMCHFQAQNVAFVLNKLFLVQTIIITLIYQLALFIVQNFKKILQWIQSYEDAPFLGTKWFIYSNFFLEKIIIIFIYPSAPFIVQNLKTNSYNGCRVVRMHHFWAQNDPFAQMRIFQKNC